MGEFYILEFYIRGIGPGLKFITIQMGSFVAYWEFFMKENTTIRKNC